MQLTLTVGERVRITDLFPEQEDMITRGICRDIGEKVEIDQAEMKEIKMVPARMPDGTMGWTWDQRKGKNKTINFTRVEGQFLKRRVKEMDEGKKIKDEQLDVYRKVEDAKLKDEKGKKGK